MNRRRETQQSGNAGRGMMGAEMLLRVTAIAVLGLAGAGCANETTTPSRLGMAPQAMRLLPPGTARDTGVDDLKKTHASRVLSAIALEKVTGRKPDPQRLLELD